jgi:hypothetical protein
MRSIGHAARAEVNMPMVFTFAPFSAPFGH